MDDMGEVQRPDWPSVRVDRRAVRSAIAEHGHDFGEVQLIAGGSAVHLVDGQAYRVTAGDVFVIRGTSRHGYLEPRELDLYTVAYDPREPGVSFGDISSTEGYRCLFVLEPYFRARHQFASRLRLEPEPLRTARALLDEHQAEAAAQGAGYQAVMGALIVQFAAVLCRAYTAQASGPGERLVRLAAALSYLENHFTEEVRLADLAQRACLSERHFRRLFAELYGVGPAAYLQELRLRHACRLLAETAASITQVAVESGFSDGNYLARCLRASRGVSPSEYRRRSGGTRG